MYRNAISIFDNLQLPFAHWLSLKPMYLCAWTNFSEISQMFQLNRRERKSQKTIISNAYMQNSLYKDVISMAMVHIHTICIHTICVCTRTYLNRCGFHQKVFYRETFISVEEWRAKKNNNNKNHRKLSCHLQIRALAFNQTQHRV